MNSTSKNYTHDHVFLGSAHDENAKRTLWVVALTVAMMVGEITAIVSVLGEPSANADSIRERLKPVHEVSHLTVEFRPA